MRNATENDEMQPNWLVVQAEEGLLTGVRLSRLLAGYTGSGYVTHFEQPHDAVEVAFDVKLEGDYRLLMRYALPGRTERNHLYVNDIYYGDMMNVHSETFRIEELSILSLKPGQHKVRVRKGGGNLMIDWFALAPLPRREPLTYELSNPNATKEALTVMRYLRDIHGKRMLTGQHAVPAAGDELAFIEEKTGKLPAIRSYDLMSYSLRTETELATDHQQWEIRVSRGSIEDAIKWHKERGGLVTFCWHWHAPLGGEDKTFYTKHTNFDIRQAVIEGTPEHAATIADLDAGAEALKKLRDANVPVLWRPLHEADGGWFWWGAKGAEPYKKLWRMMYDRYANRHGLHNLIWVWNAPAPGWYPGDDVVDIAGSDIYSQRGDHGPLTFWHDYASLMTGHKKPVALTENGPIPDPDLVMKTGTPWLWYTTWGGGFVTSGESTSFAQLWKTYHHPYMVTLDQLPDWNGY